MGGEVLSLLRDAVPWDAKRFGHRENIGEVVREDVRQGLSGDGWLAEEDKVVDPFDDWVDAVVSEYLYARVCDRALNTTCCCQSFNGDMLDIYVAVPQNCKVSLVIGIMAEFRYAFAMSKDVACVLDVGFTLRRHPPGVEASPATA